MIDERRDLLERLEHFSLSPNKILDLDGQLTTTDDALRRRFPAAQIIATRATQTSDAATSSFVVDTLLTLWRRLRGRAPPVEWRSMNDDRIPLEDHSVDLLLALRFAPGIDTLDAALLEARRVVVPGGLFLFTTLGAGSGPNRPDMHDLGSALMRAGFVEPVLDIDRRENSAEELIHVATFAGADRARSERAETLVPFPSLSSRR